jgi:hypothetical protein
MNSRAALLAVFMPILASALLDIAGWGILQ